MKEVTENRNVNFENEETSDGMEDRDQYEDPSGQEVNIQDFDEGQEECQEEVDEDKKSDKKLLKKKGKVDKKQDAMKQVVGELEDKVKRQMAEFDNFRKRTEKEKTFMFETGAKSIIEKILPVVDNFERGLATIAEEDKGAFADGMQMIYKQMMTELASVGVKPIEAIGQEFNPDYHNAVMQVESEEYESGVIAQELQKGYVYRETVVRHSMVAVVS